MKRSTLTHLALALILGFLLSCSSDDGTPTDTGDGDGGGPVTETITPAGGVITATTSDGTSVTLDFPPGAVRADAEITLRPADPTVGSVFGMRLEPAGMIFYEAVDFEVTLPDGSDLTDMYLIIGDGADPWYLPTDIDPSTRKLYTQLNFFGLVDGLPQLPASPGDAATNHPNQLGTNTTTCQSLIATLETRFDFYVAQGDFMEAVQLAKTIAATLNQNGCLAEVAAWVDIAENTACDGLAAALGDALATPTNDYGVFLDLVSPIVEFMMILQEINLGSTCAALADVDAVIDAEIADFIAFFNQEIGALAASDYGAYQNIKGEAVSLYRVEAVAQALGAIDAADAVRDDARFPAVDLMRDIAYDFCKDNGWQYHLSRLTSTGFFAPRDMVGVVPNFQSPPATQVGNFTDEDVWEDIQYCGTDLSLSTVVASGGDLDTDRVGTDGAPGQRTNEVIMNVPTRGKLRLSDKLAGFWCWTDIEADDEIAFRIDQQDVFVLRRPPGADDYLQSGPEDIDIDALAEVAGITPMEGTSTFMTIKRRRNRCEPAVWGPEEYILFEWTLVWKNPTLEVDVQMPPTVDPGQTVDVDVRVKVVDQLGQAGYFDAIDVVLQAAGGTLQQLSGQTDSLGYFRTQITADNPAPIVDAITGAAVQGVQVEATATSFEGVTAMGSATSTVGAVGYARLVSLECLGLVRSAGFRVVTQEDDDYAGTGPDWSFSAMVQSDSSNGDKSYDGTAWIDSRVELTEEGDTLTTITGTIDGSSDLTASGPFMAVEYPEAIHETEIRVEIEVIGGPVGVAIDAITEVTGEYELFFNLAGGGYGEIPNYETPPSPYHQLWGLGAGVHTLTVWAYNLSRCTCDRNGSSLIDFTIELGGPPLGGD